MEAPFSAINYIGHPSREGAYGDYFIVTLYTESINLTMRVSARDWPKFRASVEQGLILASKTREVLANETGDR